MSENGKSCGCKLEVLQLRLELLQLLQLRISCVSHASHKLPQNLETLTWSFVRHSATTSVTSDCCWSFKSPCERSRLLMYWAQSEVKSSVLPALACLNREIHTQGRSARLSTTDPAGPPSHLGTSSRSERRPHRQHHQVGEPPATVHISSPCPGSTSALHLRASSWALRDPRPLISSIHDMRCDIGTCLGKSLMRGFMGWERSAGSSAQGHPRHQFVNRTVAEHPTETEWNLGLHDLQVGRSCFIVKFLEMFVQKML